MPHHFVLLFSPFPAIPHTQTTTLLSPPTSESSLFIADHLIILKTCGTTINLLGLTRIIEIAREYCGFDHVHRCFYSRKSFFFPERQVGPHRGWKEEVDFLDGVFSESDAAVFVERLDGSSTDARLVWLRPVIDYQGNAYTVGPMNGDHWLLYLINPPSPTEEELNDVKRGTTVGGGSKSISAAKSDHRDHHHRHDHDHHHHHHHHPHDSRQNGSYAGHGVDISIQRPSHEHQDQTLEMLMTHLSADARAPFFHPPELDMNQASASSSTPTAGATEEPRSGHYLGSLVTQHLGIDKLFDKDESIIDSFGFEPCGYSANGIIGSGSGYPSSSTEVVAAAAGEDQDREGGGYWTIHVTPEEGYSFASFECNVPLPLKNEGLLPSGKRSHRPDLKTLIRRVVDIFEPGRLSITLFLSSESENALFNANNQNGNGGTGNASGNGTYSNPSESSSLADSGILADSGVLEPAHETEATRRAWTAFSKNLLGDAYVRKDRIGYEFEDYDLVFGCFEKRGFKRALQKATPVQT